MIYPEAISRRGFLRTALAVSAGTSLVQTRLDAAAGDPFLRYPNLQNVSATGASVLWTLPVLAQCSLQVTDPAGNTVSTPASVQEFDPSVTGMAQTYFQYQATLSNLAPDTTYVYEVQADGVLLVSLQLHTPGAGPFNFLHFADSGEGNDQQLQLMQQMAQEDVALVLANGDLAYDLATYQSVESNYYGVYRAMMTQIPFFGSLGNHEYYSRGAASTLDSRVTPTAGVPNADQGRYYSFDWGNVHFVVLDSNQPLTDAAAGNGMMLQWLDSDLRATRKFWRVVMFHHPGYATGVHQNEPPAGLVRQYIVPILEKYGIQLVLNGHEHTCQRTYELLGGQTVTPNSGGIVYITSGGGGAPPYWTAPNSLIAQSLGINNYLHGRVAGGTISVGARGLGGNGDVDSVILAPQPRISSVVNSASLSTDLAGGGGVTIFGRNLCPAPTFAPPQSSLLAAAGCSVTLNGVPIPLLYADAVQINAQIPFGVSGPMTLMVITPNGTVQTTITIALVAPQIFVGQDGSAMAFHADGSPVNLAAPASPNETINVFLTGLGPVNPSCQAGSVPAQPASVTASIGVTVNGAVAQPGPASLSAFAPGLYELSLRVPGSVHGAATIQVFANGVPSNQPILIVA